MAAVGVAAVSVAAPLLEEHLDALDDAAARLERLGDEGGVARDVGRLETRRLEAAEERSLRQGEG